MTDESGITVQERDTGQTEQSSRRQRMADRSRDHFEGAKARTKELSWLMFGRLAMTGANSALMILLSIWFLDIGTFGLFATAVGAQLLLSRLVLLGVDQGMIRLFTVNDQARRLTDVVGTGLSSSLLVAVPLLVGGLIASALDLSALHQLAHPAILASIALGAVGTALFDYGYAERIARLEHRAAAILQSAMPIARMALTLVVASSTAKAEAHWVFLAYAGVAFVVGVTQAIRIARGRHLWAGWSEVRSLWRYSKWTGLSDVAMILALQQGLFLLNLLEQKTEAGVYGFSLTFGMGFFAVYLAFYQTILPRAARIESTADIPRFLKRVYTMAAALIAICIPIAFLIGYFLPSYVVWLKPDEPELAGFATSFYYYAGFTMLLILEAPLGVTSQFLLKPQLQFTGMVIRCVAIGGFGFWLVPEGGAVAAGQAQVLGAVIALAAFAWIMTRAIRARRLSECVES